MIIMAIIITEMDIGTNIKPLFNGFRCVVALGRSTLPIGGFNHSNGLETFVQQRVVESKATLEEYVQTQLFYKTGFTTTGRIFLLPLMQCVREF